MSQRIRYVKSGTPDEIVSVKTYIVGEEEYRVYINLVANGWQVVQLPSEQVVLEGFAASKHKAKIAAKAALQSLNVVFDAEERDSKSKPLKNLDKDQSAKEE